MDKKLKKIKYQELFLSKLRNTKFGEEKIEDALKELETTTNMRKLASALKNIWKQTDENVRKLELVFPKTEPKVLSPEIKVVREIKVKPDLDPAKNKPVEAQSDKKLTNISEFKNLKIVSYDHLTELVDELSLEEVTEILTSVAEQEKNDHQYLARLAEKLLKSRDSKKIPDSKA